MKSSFKKTSTIVLILSILSVGLIGCGTGADSGGMSNQSSKSTVK